MLIGMMAIIQVLAQQIQVSGKIVDDKDNSPIPGVSVLVKGTTQGTTSDASGLYQISVGSNQTLVFSFIGMKTIELPVNGQSRIDVSLEAANENLEEVMVIGYGSVRKSDVTGSVSQVGVQTIEKIKPVKIEEALQGTMSGVNVTAQSGAPGAGLDIRIRGISTNGDASPVVIIDGYIGDLNTLNPNDIKSITVLKDAQAAIYGTVGANGIILVTTKQGQRNSPTHITLNSSYGIQETTRKLPVLNATEYAVLLNESYAANAQNIPFTDLSGLGLGTDWQTELFDRAPIIDNNISVSGGNALMNYNISASDLRQEGTIGGEKSNFDRSTARIALDTDLAKWLKFSSNINFTTLSRSSFNDFGLGSVLFNAMNIPSTIPVYQPNGDYYLAPGNLGIEIINPLQQLANTYNEYNLGKFNGNAGLEAKLSEHLTATARIGFNTAQAESKSFSKIVNYGGKVFDVTRSSVYQSRENYNDYTFDAFLNYERKFAEFHQLTGTIGTSVYKTWGDHLSATGYDIPNNSWEFADISLANGIVSSKTTGSWEYDQRRLSYFARVQYDYDSKYLASLMLRRDASTKFGPENSAAWFPSATLGWVISRENFFKSFNSINLAKVRVSYGMLGSDKIGDFRYISQLNGEAMYVFDNQLVPGQSIGALPNPEIKWEQSRQFDAGADIHCWGDKLEITLDYFNKTTANLLIPGIPVSGILGTYGPGGASPTVNAGTVNNQGLEFAISYHGAIKKDFSYNLSYNFTTLKNEVLEVNNGTGFIEGGSFGVGQPYPARMEVGFPIGYYYGYQTNGIFQNQEEVDNAPSQLALGSEASPGDLRFVDTDGNGVINADDRTYLGDPIPDVVMGLNFTARYKSFDFAMFTYASIGNEIVRNYERTQPNVNRLDYWLARWTGEGSTDEVPRLTTAATANTVFSDFYVEDGSYFRIQKIQLGYTIPETSKVKRNQVRFYVSVGNLFTLTNYMGYDPAASSGAPIGAGFDAGFYPASRTYTLGLTIQI